jgi:hypothetical protein
MPAAIVEMVEKVRQDAARAVRNLPDAHASWQFWRNASFRRAIRDVVEALDELDVERFSDEHFQSLETVVHRVLQIIDVHVAGLHDGVRDKVDREYFRIMTAHLRTALEGLEQGLAPDPAKRPTHEQLMSRLADGLRRAGVA